MRSGLAGLLEKKRGQFPRLFFLSNEELVDIVGQGPGLVDSLISGEASTSFITNLFEGIDTLSFHDITCAITKIRSKEGEEVILVRDVSTRGVQADSWLRGLETSLALTVKDRAFHAFASMDIQELQEWVTEWPGQTTFLSSQVWFTMKVRSIFMSCSQAALMRYSNLAPGAESAEAQEALEAPQPVQPSQVDTAQVSEKQTVTEGPESAPEQAELRTEGPTPEDKDAEGSEAEGQKEDG